jgi:DNA-binding NarL/FixJ family response regulator
MRDGREGQISVVVVEDHEVVAETLARALGAEPEIRVVAIAGTVSGGLAAARAHHPTIVVMDYTLPDGTGVTATATLKAELPETEVVMLTGRATGETLVEALEAGCSGFVAKEGSFDQLVQAIRCVAKGEVRVPPDLMAELAAHIRPRAPAPGSDLTTREHQVLGLLALGYSTDDIYGQLFLSIHTVRNHIRNILTKLHARSRLEAVAIATRLGLLDDKGPGVEGIRRSGGS